MDRHLRRFFILALIARTPPSFALDGCYYYVHAGSDVNTCADPSGRSVSGASFPSFSDAFNANPAAIPVIPTPLGLEFIGNTVSNPFAENAKTNVALIKGFQNVGTAMSTNSDKTFFSSDIGNAVMGTDYQQAYQDYVNSMNPKSSFNIGSAIGLALEKIKKVSIPSLGFGLRYNRLTDRFDYQPGISLNSEFLHFGYSFILHSANPDRYQESYQTKTYNLGVRYSIFSLDATRLEPDNPAYHEATTLYTLSAHTSWLFLTAAHRRFRNIEMKEITLNMFAAHVKLARYLAAGYLYNYIPGSHSFVVQLLF